MSADSSAAVAEPAPVAVAQSDLVATALADLVVATARATLAVTNALLRSGQIEPSNYVHLRKLEAAIATYEGRVKSNGH